jgi:hypothetical protein
MLTGILPVDVDYKDPISSLLQEAHSGRRQYLIGPLVEYCECRWMYCFYHSQQLHPDYTSLGGASHGNMLLPITMIALLKHTLGSQSTTEMMHGEG